MTGGTRKVPPFFCPHVPVFPRLPYAQYAMIRLHWENRGWLAGKAMTETIVLSRVLGIFLVIVGAAVLLRRHYFIPVFGAIVQERLVRAVVALIELLAGLFLVVVHNDWSSLQAGIITLFGWMAIVESSAYLLLPDSAVRKFIRFISTPAWYAAGGALAIVLGAWLALHGFGFIATPGGMQ